MTMTAPARGTLLDGVDHALITAHCRIAEDPDVERTHRSLIALAEAAFDALVDWESGAGGTGAERDEQQVWREQLDELRLQAALAAMEARDRAEHVDARVEHLVARIAAEVEELTRLTSGRTSR